MKRILVPTLLSLAACASGPADAGLADPPSRGQEMAIDIAHVAPAPASCSGYLHHACRDPKHWILRVNDLACPDVPRMRAFIKREAGRWPSPAPLPEGMSELNLKLTIDAGAPYFRVQDAMASCADAGIHRMNVATTNPPAEPKPASPIGIASDWSDQEIRVHVGPTANFPAKSRIQQSLIQLVAELQSTADWLKKTGASDVHVVLFPAAEIAWSEIDRIMSVCRENKLMIEFAAPFDAKK